MNVDIEPSGVSDGLAGATPASQTLLRGLDVLEQVAGAPVPLHALASRLGLSRSTVHRLAAVLLERRYLSVVPRGGYSLGPKLLELGFLAREQISLVQLSRPHLEALAAESGEMTLLAIRDGESALVADRVAGQRRLVPSLRPGDHLPLLRSALGRALLMDDPSEPTAARRDATDAGAATTAGVADFYGAQEPELRAVAAPLRDAGGTICGAVGVAAAAAYVDDSRAALLSARVRHFADHISAELGWRGAGLPEAAEQDLLGQYVRTAPRDAGVSPGQPALAEAAASRHGVRRPPGGKVTKSRKTAPVTGDLASGAAADLDAGEHDGMKGRRI